MNSAKQIKDSQGRNPGEEGYEPTYAVTEKMLQAMGTFWGNHGTKIKYLGVACLFALIGAGVKTAVDNRKMETAGSSGSGE